MNSIRRNTWMEADFRRAHMNDAELLQCRDRIPKWRTHRALPRGCHRRLVMEIEQSGGKVALRPGEFWMSTNIGTRTGFKGGAAVRQMAQSAPHFGEGLVRDSSQAEAAAVAANAGLLVSPANCAGAHNRKGHPAVKFKRFGWVGWSSPLPLLGRCGWQRVISGRAPATSTPTRPRRSAERRGVGH